MRLATICALWAALAGFGFAQTGTVVPLDGAVLKAESLVHDGSVVRGVGHASVKLGDMVFQADEFTLSTETGELELRGHATVALPARPDHYLFRYPHHAAVVDESVLLADVLSLKDHLLRGSGHVQVKATDTFIEADGIEMSLSNGDGRVSGKIRRNGETQDAVQGDIRNRLAPIFKMPPDIMQ